MTEEQVFLAALDLPDEAARAAYLDEACGQDMVLRRKVDGLLSSHFRSGEFLDVPAPEQVDAGSGADFPVTIQSDAVPAAKAPDDEDEGLSFLSPGTRPDSLGRIGHYEVLQVLGKGGFGIVFRAFDDTLQRVVAIKVMAPQLAATSPARKRFLREARSSAQVRHENVVQVYEVNEVPLPYLTMEFIPGETLQQRLDRTGPLGPEEIVSLSRQIAQGLAAAHATGLIHRDIKPGNVLIEGGASDRVKITDFGLARAADDASMTQSGMVAGTPMYMAPEQAQGETLDQRADLFSLGSVMYVMASGRPPFRAATTFAVLKRVVEEEPRPIKDVIPETPQWLCDIIARLHAKNPADRFQSAAEVAQALDESLAYLRDPARAPQPKAMVAPASPAPRVASLPQAPRQLAWGWLAALAALCAVPALGCLALIVALAIPAYQARQADMVRKLSGVQGGTKESPLNVQSVSLPPLVVDEWMPLFNGKGFTGWRQDGYWTIENGMLVSRIPATPTKQPGFLTTERSDFRDFHLRLEGKINAPGDSGVFFRFGEQGDASLQAQIVPSPNHAGSLLRDATTVVPATLSIKPETWFTMEVIAQGPRVEVLIDGKKAAEWSYPAGAVPSGPIALESGFPKTEFTVRKIEVKPLSASRASEPGWVQLFNGKDLAGWKQLPSDKGEWKVTDGVLTGRWKNPTHLFTTRQDFQDFHLRVEMRVAENGTGIGFRCPERLHGFGLYPLGYRAYALDGADGQTGTLYSYPRELKLAESAEELASYETWFTLEVIARGDKLVTLVNGKPAAQATDTEHVRGSIALTGSKEVEFRKVEIRELPDSAPAAAPLQPRQYASDEWIDVIPLIDPQLDKWDMRLTGKNKWRIDNGELIAGYADDKPCKLLLPLDANWRAFECEVEFTRRTGTAGFNLNIPTAVGDCPVVLNPPNAPGVYLGRRGGGVALNEVTRLVTDQRTTLRLQVRPEQNEDHVTVWVDDVEAGNWQGDRISIASVSNEGYPHARRLSLWVHAGGNELAFHKIRVHLLDGGTAESLRQVPIVPSSGAPGSSADILTSDEYEWTD